MLPDERPDGIAGKLYVFVGSIAAACALPLGACTTVEVIANGLRAGLIDWNEHLFVPRSQPFRGRGEVTTITEIAGRIGCYGKTNQSSEAVS